MKTEKNLKTEHDVVFFFKRHSIPLEKKTYLVKKKLYYFFWRKKMKEKFTLFTLSTLEHGSGSALPRPGLEFQSFIYQTF